MISPVNAIATLEAMGISHVVWIPDSLFGQWEGHLQNSSLRLIRVCREGEAWPLAAGLWAGGAQPLVIMQTTGLFESGDALRNVGFDLKCPLYAWIGVRNWLNPNSPDSARRFAVPQVDAWQLDHVWVENDGDFGRVKEHYADCRTAARLGIALIAEGAG